MSIDNLTFGELKQVAAMFGAKPAIAAPAVSGDGRSVIVRSRDAGVLFGEYAGHETNGTVHLKNARQLWKWKAAKGGTLIDVATYGVEQKNCKFSPAQASVSVFNACALIDCTDSAANSIRSAEGEKWA